MGWAWVVVVKARAVLGSVEIASVFFIGGEELKGQVCTVLN